MITSDVFVMILYSGISLVITLGVLLLIQLLQFIYAWVHDNPTPPNMLIASVMLGLLNYSKKPSGSEHAYEKEGNFDSDGIVGFCVLMEIAIILPPLVALYTVTLITAALVGVMYLLRFCLRVNKQVFVLQHDNTSILPKDDRTPNPPPKRR